MEAGILNKQFELIYIDIVKDELGVESKKESLLKTFRCNVQLSKRKQSETEDIDYTQHTIEFICRHYQSKYFKNLENMIIKYNNYYNIISINDEIPDRLIIQTLKTYEKII